MRYELNDNEWRVIKPMLPNRPRGVPRVDDRRVLNGIFWVLRSGAPWCDLAENYGPPTTCYNRFVRWRRADIWDRIKGDSIQTETMPGSPNRSVRCPAMVWVLPEVSGPGRPQWQPIALLLSDRGSRRPRHG
jgi:hypothetical protein